MLLQMAFALGLIIVSVVIHAAGTMAVILWHAPALENRVGRRGSFASGLLTIRVVSILLAFHLLEASAWAALYWLAGLLPDMETAIYFSFTSYTTVGYGDVVLPPEWRLLGPIESSIGILLFGWSTALMVASITRIYSHRLRDLVGARVPEENAEDSMHTQTGPPLSI